jgi:hypothetical protein
LLAAAVLMLAAAVPADYYKVMPVLRQDLLTL